MIVVMPIGGLGKRFVAAGYTFAKPLITIRNRPMLQWAVESLGLPWAQHVFVCNQEDVERYPIQAMCRQITPHQSVVVETKRQGAAAAVLLGLEHQREDEELVIANSDQWLQWDANRFMDQVWRGRFDGALPVFQSAHPKWSFAQLGPEGLVKWVAEKQPISPWATCGIYYWRTIKSFRECAARMMGDEAKRVNGEWYVAPVYNELLSQGGRVMVYDDLEMWGLGTPEDLEEFKLKVCR